MQRPRDPHRTLSLETIRMDDVMTAIDGAQELRVVILDAETIRLR
jgi:hypothetical protein